MYPVASVVEEAIIVPYSEKYSTVPCEIPHNDLDTVRE